MTVCSDHLGCETRADGAPGCASSDGSVMSELPDDVLARIFHLLPEQASEVHSVFLLQKKRYLCQRRQTLSAS